MLTPILISGWASSMETLPSVEAMIRDLPELDSDFSASRLIFKVRMLPETDVSMLRIKRLL